MGFWRQTIWFAIVLGIILVPLPTVAHHSYTRFDMTRAITLEGTVKEFQWSNPHVWIQLVVKDPVTGEEIEWSIESDSPNMLARRGWSRSVMRPGDRAVAVVHPPRKGVDFTAALESLEINGQAVPGSVATAAGGSGQPSPVPRSPSTVGAPSGPGSLAGLWMKAGFRKDLTLASLRTPDRDKVQKTIDGEWPPLQPWASEDVERRIRSSQQGDPVPTTITECLPGIPWMLLGGGGYPIQILETAGQVTMLFEEQNHYRVIHLDAEHPEDPDPAYMGHSTGHWEGGTLVVDTIGLIDSTPIDWLGTPHSDALHLVERYQRSSTDTLELVMTIDDPNTFTRPWDTRQVFRLAPDGARLTEYICDNNRDRPGATP